MAPKANNKPVASNKKRIVESESDSEPPSEDDTISEISHNSSKYSAGTGPTQSTHSRRSSGDESQSRSSKSSRSSSGSRNTSDGSSRSERSSGSDDSESRSQTSASDSRNRTNNRKVSASKQKMRKNSSSESDSGSEDPSDSEPASDSDADSRTKTTASASRSIRTGSSSGPGSQSNSESESFSESGSGSEPESSEPESESVSSDDASGPESSRASSSSGKKGIAAVPVKKPEINSVRRATAKSTAASAVPEEVLDTELESEDDLPAPPPHILAKIVAAKAKAAINMSNAPLNLSALSDALSAGLKPVQPDGLSGVPSFKTTLRTRTIVGQTSVELMSGNGIAPGTRLMIGTGSKIDRSVVLVGTKISTRIVLENPLKFSHKPGVAVLVFDLSKDNKPRNNPLSSIAASEQAPVVGPNSLLTNSKPIVTDTAAAPDMNSSLDEEDDVEKEESKKAEPKKDRDNQSVVSHSSKLTHSTQTPSIANTKISNGARALIDLEQTVAPVKSPAEIILEALDDGYNRVQVRFLGFQDPWEDAYYLFSPDQRWLKILVGTAEGVATFDVGGGHCTVGEDGRDLAAAFMEYHEQTIHFKMPNEKKLQNFLDEFPDNCFMYPEDVNGEAKPPGPAPPTEESKTPSKPRAIDAKFEQKVKDTSNYVNAQAEARKARVQKTVEKLKAKQQGQTLEALLDTLDGTTTRVSLSQIANRSGMTGAIGGPGAAGRMGSLSNSSPRHNALSQSLVANPNSPAARLSLNNKLPSRSASGLTNGMASTKVPFGNNPNDDEDEPLPPPPKGAPQAPDTAGDWMVPPKSPHTPPAPKRRKELIDTRIKKHVPSVRRVTLLCRWLNFLHFWPVDISITSMHAEFCTGLLLMELMKVLVPGCESQYTRINRKTLSRKPAESNLEQAIGVIFRSKSINHARIPKASEIFDGNITKICMLVDELFIAYIQSPLYKSAMKMFRWYTKILKQYQRPLPEDTFDSGDVGYIWPSFQSGVSLFCIIYHFFGPSTIGKGSTTVKIDPIRVVSDARSYDDMKANITYVFQLLRALDIQLLWEPEEWLTLPDTEFCILQLSYIYEFLCTRQCILSPATNETPGLATGRSGETLVVGLTFADTACAGIDRHRHTKHVTTLLGAAENTMPMLSVDIVKRATSLQSDVSGISSREISSLAGIVEKVDDLNDTVPLGLLSGNVRIEKKKVKLAVPTTTRTLVKPTWDSKTSISETPVSENVLDAPVIQVLRSINQKNTPAPGTADAVLDITGVPKYQFSTKKPLSKIRRELLLGAQIDEYDRRSSIVSVDMENLKKGIVNLGHGGTEEPEAQRAQRQLTLSMTKLEEEMNQSNKELAALEEELEARYLVLEDEAGAYDEKEYESTLAFLDDETTRLEADRLRIQQLFAMKLTSIRDQYDESVVRTKARIMEQQQRQPGGSGMRSRNVKFNDDDDVSVMTGSTSQGGGVTFGPDNVRVFNPSDTMNTTLTSNASTGSSRKSSKTTTAKSAEEKAKLEKGWTLHSRKTFSHNRVIQKNIDQSRLQLYQSWQSPKSKEKEAKQAELEAKRVAARLGLAGAQVGKQTLKHLFKEATYVDQSDAVSVRSQGSSKSGQVYAHILTPQAQEQVIKNRSLEARLDDPTSQDPASVFEAFRVKLYTRTSVWFEKRGQQRDLPNKPITEPPLRPVIPLLQQLLSTSRPLSTARTTTSNVGSDDNSSFAGTGESGYGPTLEQVNLWKRIRKSSLESFAWEEYRQNLAGKYVPPVRSNAMKGLFGDTADEEGKNEQAKDGADAGLSEADAIAAATAAVGGSDEAKQADTGTGVTSGRRSSMKKVVDMSVSEAVQPPAPLEPPVVAAITPAVPLIVDDSVIPSVISTSEADAAVRYLTAVHVFVLADRTNTEYLWVLSMNAAVNNTSSNFSSTAANGNQSLSSNMVLQWFSMSDQNGPAVGSVNLADVKTLTYDAVSGRRGSGGALNSSNTGLIISLNLNTIPKALKASGGRTKIILKGTQIQEAKKFHFCLRNLWLIATKQSKLVAVESINSDI